MASGYEPQPVGIAPIYLGVVSDMDVANREKGKIYIMNYTANSSNIPVANAGGFGFLFINADNAYYGRQIAISNTGLYSRTLANGAYNSWTTIQ